MWKDHLVSVTPNSIRDGKVYIHHMSPSGGKYVLLGLFAETRYRDLKVDADHRKGDNR